MGSPVITYRGYEIYCDPKPVPRRDWDWTFVHRQYDGPEDRRCGTAASLKVCKREIDLLEDQADA